MKISIQKQLFSDKEKERISKELLNGIGAQPTPQPVAKKRPCEMDEAEKKEYNYLRKKNWREANRERNNNNIYAWKNKNPDKVYKWFCSWVERNLDHFLNKNKAWNKNNKERVRFLAKKNQAVYRLELRDSYIKRNLKKSGILNPSRQLILITKVNTIQTRLDSGTLNKELAYHYLNIINQLKQEVLCS